MTLGSSLSAAVESESKGYRPSSCDHSSGKGEGSTSVLATVKDCANALGWRVKAPSIVPLGAAVVPSYRAAASGDSG